MGYSLQGLHNYVTSAISQDYWLGRVYPPQIAEAHLSGDLHIHDAGMLGPYCVGWDMEDFRRRGVVPIAGKVAAQPPRHFRSALGQLVNLLYTLQGEAAGAQAVSTLDTLKHQGEPTSLRPPHLRPSLLARIFMLRGARPRAWGSS